MGTARERSTLGDGRIGIEAALELAGKKENDRLRGFVMEIKRALEEGRRGDALRLCRQALVPGGEAALVNGAHNDLPCDSEPA
jgi:hypothetical protein